MSKIITTLSGEEIKGDPVDKVTVYDEDNVPWVMNPIDAREAVATGRYRFEDPEGSEAAADESDAGTQPKTLKGPLPDGFPGKAALEEAGYNTYAKVRKLRDQGKLTEVPNIGDITAEQIEDSL